MAHYRDTIDDLLAGARSPPAKASASEEYLRSPLSEMVNDARRARRASIDDIMREAREAELEAESARIREEIARLEAERATMARNEIARLETERAATAPPPPPSPRALYETLGLSRDATEADVKKAYRKQCLKHHPDKGGDTEAFQRVKEAHDVLGDPRKRAVYDVRGDGGPRRSEEPSKDDTVPEPKVVACTATLTDIALGGEATVSFRRRVGCGACDGTGARLDRAQPCLACDGSGVLVMPTHGFRLERIPCGACGGGGLRAPECHACCGAGCRVEAGDAVISIPKGAEDGARVCVEGAGDVGAGGSRGDLVAVLRLADDKNFMRHGVDLILRAPLRVSLRNALGGTVDVAAPTLDATVRIRTSPGTVVAPGRFYASEGLGLPARDNAYLRGRLVVSFDVEFPAQLSETQAAGVAAILDGDAPAGTDGSAAPEAAPPDDDEAYVYPYPATGTRRAPDASRRSLFRMAAPKCKKWNTTRILIQDSCRGLPPNIVTGTCLSRRRRSPRAASARAARPALLAGASRHKRSRGPRARSRARGASPPSNNRT